MEKRIEITVEDAVQIGIQFLMRGQVSDAEKLFEKLLEAWPKHPDALHYSGVIAHKRGRTEEGLARVRASLEHSPDQPDWHSNLGILLESIGDGEGAMREFQQAIDLEPQHAIAHNNLGVLRRIYGRLPEAEASLRAAIAIRPEYADAFRNLAVVLERCEEWVRIAPDDPVAKHTLAACAQRDIPLRAADDYIATSFDSFAETFEAKLTRLDYKAPGLVAAAIAETGLATEKQLDVLDAGCGTGWCGPLLAPYAKRLVGVDLSTGMLEHARAKSVYDELEHAELVGYLKRQHEAFDVIVSADTLVYFGALDEFASAASGALRPGGWLTFTVEEAAPDTETFHLEVHGRYNHAAPYVESVLTSAGLAPHVGHAVLRQESGLPVAGLVIRAEKRPGDDRGPVPPS